MAHFFEDSVWIVDYFCCVRKLQLNKQTISTDFQWKSIISKLIMTNDECRTGEETKWTVRNRVLSEGIS